jgi:hypothetical protein
MGGKDGHVLLKTSFQQSASASEQSIDHTVGKIAR